MKSDEPDDDLVREAYARFGLAYYQSECLHRELCFVLAWSGLPSAGLVTRPRADERLAQAFSLTLGDVASRLEGILPAQLASEVRQAVDTRNFLAHHFWFDRVHLMFSVESIRQLIAELSGYAEMFDLLDAKVSEWSKPMRDRLGLTDEVIEESLRRTLEGEAAEPLPDRQAVRELERRLARRQRLVRVWHFTLGDGRNPLIFELADGSLWQLSDIGLGWTRYHEKGPDWTEHPATKLHLPADIVPRPQVASPWDYEFMLGDGAVLWVKPGSKKHTFVWGVRTQGTRTEQTT